MLWSKWSISALLEYVMVKIDHFSMAGICHGQNCQFQHSWNVSWSKLSVLACREYVVVTIVSISMSGMCHSHNYQFCHV
jgi:hypothetical protein